MPVRRVMVHGRWRWQVWVSYRGRRVSRLCESRARGVELEAEIVQRMRNDSAGAENEGSVLPEKASDRSRV